MNIYNCDIINRGITKGVVFMTGIVSRVLIMASLKNRDVSKIKDIVDKHPDAWLLTDPNSVEVLAKLNILSRLSPDRIIVFNGRKPEEFTLKIYSVLAPDIVYLCDERGSLKPILDFMARAPVDVVEC
jgi:hypothetical protein